jgi:hypothetical protein
VGWKGPWCACANHCWTYRCRQGGAQQFAASCGLNQHLSLQHSQTHMLLLYSCTVLSARPSPEGN